MKLFYDIVTTATPYAFLIAACAVALFFAFIDEEIAASIIGIIGIVAFLVAVATGLTEIIIDTISEEYYTETVSMTVVAIEYDEGIAELRFPKTNNGISVDINNKTPIIEVGDTVEVKINKKFHKITKSEKILDGNKILRVLTEEEL